MIAEGLVDAHYCSMNVYMEMSMMLEFLHIQIYKNYMLTRGSQ